MSQNNYILNLLNIKDENIAIDTNNLQTKEIKGKKTQILTGYLTYKPEYCKCCGCVSEKDSDIIRWGFKKTKIIIPAVSNIRSLLILYKQRFYCNICRKTFIAETSIVDKYKNISKNTDMQIRLDLMKKQSEKDIAEKNNVSSCSVNRILNNISTRKVMRHEYLPEEMNIDEFMATKDTIGKMALIITNNKTGKIYDIQNSRKNRDLDKYFQRFSRSERLKVKLISTDFYSGYISIAKKYLKNANIVIDRFHIVAQVYQALNSCRISYCKKSNKNYKKLKNYWKLIIKNENNLSDIKHYCPCFKKEVSQKEIVTYIINTEEELKATYECYQGIIKSLDEKDFNKFLNIINHPNNKISEKMKKALKLYRNNTKYIENSFKYEINNGKIEGKNNLIKTIKRISFGYRKYEHFISRIFLIDGIIKG